jgi:hypothetical protein
VGELNGATGELMTMLHFAQIDEAARRGVDAHVESAAVDESPAKVVTNARLLEAGSRQASTPIAARQSLTRGDACS